MTQRDEEEQTEPEIPVTAAPPVVSGKKGEETGDLVNAGPVELGVETDVRGTEIHPHASQRI